MKSSFTEKGLDALKADPGQRYEIQDAKVEGLVVRVLGRKDGTVGLTFRWRRKGINLHLGKRCEAFGLSEAREAARKRNFELDSKSLEVVRKNVPTLQEAWEALRKYNIVGHVRASTLKRYDEVAKLWGELAEVRINKVTLTDTRVLHARLGKENGHRSANMAIDLISRAWESAADLEQTTGRNPCRGVRRFTIKARDRVMTDQELNRLIKESVNEEPIFQDAFWFLMLTGARIGNVVAMAWEEVDLKVKTWKIPGTKAKAKDEIVIGLRPELVEILKRRKKSTKGDFVFEPIRSDSTTGHLSYEWLYRRFKKVAQKVGIKGVYPHIIRKTMGTTLDEAGVSPHAIALLLGHRDLESQKAYVHPTGDGIRGVLDIWGEHLSKVRNSA